jgi:tripartite-type tricarboxylate transporter receptor subunit TctC
MRIRGLLGAIAALSLSATFSLAQSFPERELLGVIMWGAGGATDVVARAVTPAVEETLGQPIVLLNRAGGTGAIATNYVHSAPADGYTLLYGAENPQLHGVLGLSELDYSDFYPVNILGRGVAVIVTTNDAPWQTLTELVEDASSRPGEIRMGSTGPGGLPHVVGSLLSTVTEFDINAIPFDGEGPGMTALLGQHVEFMPVGVGAAADHIESGRLRALAVVNDEEIDMLPGVPPITDEFPEFARYLPWGPFYGVWVRSETPDDVKAILVDAFAKAADEPSFQELMVARGNVVMNISGEEADEFLRQWQSTTTWVLHDVGATTRSPEEFDIPRP